MRTIQENYEIQLNAWEKAFDAYNTLKSALTAAGDTNVTSSSNIKDLANYSVPYIENTYKIPKEHFDNTKSSAYMFYYFKGSSVDNLIDTTATKNVTNMTWMFGRCKKIKTIPLIDTSKGTNMSYMFAYSAYLTTIPALNLSSATNLSGMFKGCTRLEEIHTTGMKVSFDISASTKFTESALVEILNNLATVTSTQTLTMRSTNLAKLTDEEKAIATDKGWTLT